MDVELVRDEMVEATPVGGGVIVGSSEAVVSDAAKRAAIAVVAR